MKAVLTILMATALLMCMSVAGCKKKSDSGTADPQTSSWNLEVKTPEGDIFVIATGAFSFTTSSFTAHIKTSRIGGGNIVKEFDLSGQYAGDSILVRNFILSLTDPVENVTLNGNIHVSESVMNGTGNYRIVQPPDTLSYYDEFVLTGIRQ